MRRWGQIAEDKPDQWYFDTAKAVYRPDLYDAAAKSNWSPTARPMPRCSPHRTGSAFMPATGDRWREPSMRTSLPPMLASFSIGLKDGQTVTPLASSKECMP
jgi:nitrate/nitrite transport system substrate-binding protein